MPSAAASVSPSAAASPSSAAAAVVSAAAAVVSAVVVGARRAGTARPERLFVEDDALLFDTAEHAGAHVSVAYRKAGLFPQPEVAGVVKIDLVGSAHIFISF